MSKPTTDSLLQIVFEEWEKERDQLFALVHAIERQLAPPSEKEDSSDFSAWKLAELGMDVLGSARDFQAIKEMTMGRLP